MHLVSQITYFKFLQMEVFMLESKSNEFRELTRTLERNLEGLNTSDCCICNISTAQCHMIVEIGRAKDSKLKELAQTLRIDTSSASKVVEELVKKELVLREQSKTDRRSVEINLTKEGQLIFKQIETDMNQVFKQVFELINESERENVLKCLKNYNLAIEHFMEGKHHE